MQAGRQAVWLADRPTDRRKNQKWNPPIKLIEFCPCNTRYTIMCVQWCLQWNALICWYVLSFIKTWAGRLSHLLDLNPKHRNPQEICRPMCNLAESSESFWRVIFFRSNFFRSPMSLGKKREVPNNFQTLLFLFPICGKFQQSVAFLLHFNIAIQGNW